MVKANKHEHWVVDEQKAGVLNIFRSERGYVFFI